MLVMDEGVKDRSAMVIRGTKIPVMERKEFIDHMFKFELMFNCRKLMTSKFLR